VGRFGGLEAGPRAGSGSGGAGGAGRVDAVFAARLVTITMRGRERVYRLDADRLHAGAGGWLHRFRPAAGGPPPPAGGPPPAVRRRSTAHRGARLGFACADAA
jgi:hypothetical protein